jgi:hypothetical protein
MTSINMRRAIATFGLLGALATPGFVFAASSSATPGGGYCSQPGCQQIRTDGAPGAGSQNGTGAGSGAFGVYGPGEHPIDRGPDTGYATGLNNSGVSGNRTVDQDAPRDHPVPQN